jgi:alpha-amylase
LYELDVRSISTNLLATLNRRPEAYHDKVRHAADHQHDDGGTKSIHDLVHFKQPDLDKKLQYDPWPRKSLVDHFLYDGATAEQFELGHAEAGDFATGVYEALLRRSEKRVEVVLSRTGQVGETALKLCKTVSLDCESANSVNIQYRLEQLPPEQELNLAVEFNFAAMPAEADDRYFYGGNGSQLGQLQTRLDLSQSIRIGLVDEWLGIDASLDFSQPAELWTFPIQTVSQSEGGFELVHQSVTVVPRWRVVADERGTWSVNIRMDLDTSIAHARRLAEPGHHFATPVAAGERIG